MALSLGNTQKVQVGQSLSLGNLTKTNPRWKVGLRWTPSPGVENVDCDLWLVMLQSGQAIELVRYDEKNADAVVVSSSGALTYDGDDRDGSKSDKLKRMDDETGTIDFSKVEHVGGDKVLLIANIYEPRGLTFDRVEKAFLRTYPEGDESTAAEIDLTHMGQGANTIIFGWHERGANGEWSFTNQPSHSPSILEALQSFGVGA